MNRLLLLLPALAALLLSAHFYRAGSLVLTVAALSIIGLLLVPRPWAARAAQVAMLAGAVEWLHTLVVLVSYRIALQQPTLRLALILLAVAAFTAACALVFQQRSLRAWYGFDRPAGLRLTGRETSRPA
jgi:hypothetical protein